MYYHLTNDRIDIEVVAMNGRVIRATDQLTHMKGSAIIEVMEWAASKHIRVLVRERAGSSQSSLVPVKLLLRGQLSGQEATTRSADPEPQQETNPQETEARKDS